MRGCTSLAHEREALDEIELYGELIIAAAAEPEDRLSRDRIDEVLRSVVQPPPER